MTQSHHPSTTDATLRPSPDVIARRLDRTGVLVHLATNRIFELNETGIRIWELIAEGHSSDAILARLLDEFEIDRAQAATELQACLDRFQREGLLAP